MLLVIFTRAPARKVCGMIAELGCDHRGLKGARAVAQCRAAGRSKVVRRVAFWATCYLEPNMA